MNTKNVIYTKSGLLIRQDSTLGVIVFSPHTGLIFACKGGGKKDLISWLNCESNNAPSVEYEKALGPGWALPMNEADFPSKHLLPNANSGWQVLRSTYPILINWLMTGECVLKCRYCYAEDVMGGKYEEPTEVEAIRIATAILSYRPIAVVLTGGDPLLSPHLKIVLKRLHKRTGIIIDTSGFSFSNSHLELFKKYGVFVRISLDSEIPSINDCLRPCHGKESPSVAAVNALCQCIDAGIGVSVQTVVSKYNRSDLEILGDKLFRMGIRSWRILMMTSSKTTAKQIKLLKGSESGQKRFDHYIEDQLRSKHENGWNKGMGVQITHNRSPNSVILVAPDGVFLTEAKFELGKVILDEKKPKQPHLDQLFAKVDPHAHAERYLNL